jgi:hypothetical protein
MYDRLVKLDRYESFRMNRRDLSQGKGIHSIIFHMLLKKFPQVKDDLAFDQKCPPPLTGKELPRGNDVKPIFCALSWMPHKT